MELKIAAWNGVVIFLWMFACGVPGYLLILLFGIMRSATTIASDRRVVERVTKLRESLKKHETK